MTDPDQLSGGRRRPFLVTPWGMSMQIITPLVDRVF
jgi:hypothetical protein